MEDYFSASIFEIKGEIHKIFHLNCLPLNKKKQKKSLISLKVGINCCKNHELSYLKKTYS
jgi:hypothetical protein